MGIARDNGRVKLVQSQMQYQVYTMQIGVSDHYPPINPIGCIGIREGTEGREVLSTRRNKKDCGRANQGLIDPYWKL